MAPTWFISPRIIWVFIVQGNRGRRRPTNSRFWALPTYSCLGTLLVLIHLCFSLLGGLQINVGSWCCGWTWVRGAVGSSSPWVLGLMDRKAIEIGAIVLDKDGGKIDYDKLIDKFGCQRLDPSLIIASSFSPPAVPMSSSTAASSLPTGTSTSQC